MAEIEERTAEIAGTQVFLREAARQTAAPVLYLHGVPTSGADWIPFLERTGGIAPDLPGFGRSAKSGGFDYSIVDSAGRRLYVSHSTHVVVLDADSGEVVGNIPNTDGVHGIAPAPDLLIGTTSAPSAPAGDPWATNVGFVSPLPMSTPGRYTATVTFTVIGR